MNSNFIQPQTENNLTFKDLLDKGEKDGWISKKTKATLFSFYIEYAKVVQTSNTNHSSCLVWFTQLLELLRFQHENPFKFGHFHKKVSHPYDYYSFANACILPLIDKNNSTVLGKNHIEEIIAHQKSGHNIILFSNHQTEVDPPAMSILLDDIYPGFVEEIIFVAGERVIKDPISVPFSLGRNLLCIYSKRYINHPPELRAEKQYHNAKTIQSMTTLLSDGGKCIYVAPSGGRDRRNANGIVEIDKFDPKNIELFYLIAQKAKKPTFFYPMTLATYNLIPPPATIDIELGEKRTAQRTTIHLSMGSCIDMENFPGYDPTDKKTKRESRAQYIWQCVYNNYKNLYCL
jgi:glycerol-3-phosphate O-acyltransferase